jgi:hypothetical protein
MLDYLKPLKSEKFDFLTFLEGDQKNSIQIQGTIYNDPGEPVDASSLGNSYHIFLFKEHEENPNEYSDVDFFDAILVDPLEYISGLIPSGWFGILARKTTTSRPLVDRMLDNFNKVV